MDLTKIERLLLLNQFKIRKVIDQTAEFDEAIEVLTAGYKSEYSNLVAGLADDMPEDDARFVVDLFTMYRCIETYRDQNPMDAPVVDHQWSQFRGFDQTKESRFVAYARFCVAMQELWPDQRADVEGTSPRSRATIDAMPNYKPMVDRWRELGEPRNLSREQVLRILPAEHAGTTADHGAVERSTMELKTDMGCGVWMYCDGERTKVEILNIVEYRQSLDPKLVIGFAKLLNAATKLDALSSCRPTVRIVGNLAFGVDHPESPAEERNRIVIACFIWGVLHELHEAVDTLNGGKLDQRLTSIGDGEALKSWDALRATASWWERDLGHVARNSLAFHLGRNDIIEKGLEDWPCNVPLTVLESFGKCNDSTFFPMGINLLLEGLGLTREKISDLSKTGTRDRDIASHAMNVFRAVLRAGKASPPSGENAPADGESHSTSTTG